MEAEPFALRVLDDSMEPEFPRGSIIVIDPSAVPEPGSFVLAMEKGEYVLRELRLVEGRYYLYALNQRYAAVPLDTGLSAVHGVIVQRAGRRRSAHKRYA